MNRVPLLSLCLVVAFGVGCSNPAQESAPAPTQQLQVKRSTQALEGMALRELPVSAEVLAATEGAATVRTFAIDAAPGEYTVDQVVAAAFQQAASDPVNLPWQAGVTQNREDSHVTLRYLNTLLPVIETEVGTDEEYSTGSYHWFRSQTEDSCELGDLYTVVFAGKVYVIESRGLTEC